MCDPPLVVNSDKLRASATESTLTAPSEREIAIRSAAISLFFEHGYAAVGIRQIAAAMSISTSTLYHYYESKLRLLEATMIDSNEILQARTEQAVEGVEDPRLRFARIAMTLVAAQIESRRTCYLMDNEMRSVSPGSPSGRRIFEQRRRYEAIWQDVITAGVDERVFSCGDNDAARVGLIGMYSQTSLWYRPNLALDRTDLCREMVDLGLASLGASHLSDREVTELAEAIDFIRFAWEPPTDERPGAEFPRYADLMSTP